MLIFIMQKPRAMQVNVEKYIDFDLKAIPCDRIEACKMALLKRAKMLWMPTLLKVWRVSAVASEEQAVLLTAKRIRLKLINTEEKLFEKTLQR